MIYSVDRLPSASTITLGTGIDQLSIRKTHPSQANFSKWVAVTNLSEDSNLYLSFWENAMAEVEELTVLPGVSVNIDVTKTTLFDIFVRWTSGEKYTYFIM